MLSSEHVEVKVERMESVELRSRFDRENEIENEIEELKVVEPSTRM